MKTLKQLIESIKKDAEKNPEFLSWKSAHSEVRDNVKKTQNSEEPSFLSWKSSHAEVRDSDKSIGESTKTFGSYKRNTRTNHLASSGALYNPHVHDKKTIAPTALEDHHIDAIHAYSSAKSDSATGHMSSKNLNGYLRNRAGKKDHKISHQREQEVKIGVKQLSSAFTKENTNRKHLTTFGGVPPSIGHELMKGGKGKKHVLAGFTSTSTSQHIAAAFSNTHHLLEEKGTSEPLHVVKYHLKPHTGMSIAHHSKHDENEVLINHGHHIQYIKTTEHEADNHNSHKVLVHHVVVHPTRKPLSKYGKYKHPEE